MDYFDINNIDFKPYDRYGKDSIVTGLSWKNLHYDEKTYCGTYLLRFDKDTQSKYHEHMDYEEFLILRGTLYDSHSNRVHLLVHMLKCIQVHGIIHIHLKDV